MSAESGRPSPDEVAIRAQTALRESGLDAENKDIQAGYALGIMFGLNELAPIVDLLREERDAMVREGVASRLEAGGTRYRAGSLGEKVVSRLRDPDFNPVPVPMLSMAPHEMGLNMRAIGWAIARLMGGIPNCISARLAFGPPGREEEFSVTIQRSVGKTPMELKGAAEAARDAALTAKHEAEIRAEQLARDVDRLTKELEAARQHAADIIARHDEFAGIPG